MTRLLVLLRSSDEWIRERTGVERRHIAEEETTVSMAVEAGRQAVEEAGISPEEIDMILVATGSADRVFPCISLPGTGGSWSFGCRWI